MLVYFLVKAFRSCGTSPWFPLFLTLFAFCIGRLALSGTFWTETYFWGLLAVMGLCAADLKRLREPRGWGGGVLMASRRYNAVRNIVWAVINKAMVIIMPFAAHGYDLLPRR